MVSLMYLICSTHLILQDQWVIGPNLVLKPVNQSRYDRLRSVSIGWHRHESCCKAEAESQGVPVCPKMAKAAGKFRGF